MSERARQLPISDFSGSSRRGKMPAFVFGGTIDITKWSTFAACSSPTVEMVTPIEEEKELLINTYCLFCPVRDACLDSAFTFGDPSGIWGGTTESDRKRLKKIPGFVNRIKKS